MRPASLPAPLTGLLPSLHAGDQFFKARQELYTSIGLDLEHRGLQLGGVITQGLVQSDLFTFAKDAATRQLLPVPVLKPLDVPVRAIIIPVSDAAVSRKLRAALQAHLVPLVPASLLWLQNHTMYHSTLLHASSHAVRSCCALTVRRAARHNPLLPAPIPLLIAQHNPTTSPRWHGTCIHRAA
jgi:hypothetical protein